MCCCLVINCDDFYNVRCDGEYDFAFGARTETAFKGHYREVQVGIIKGMSQDQLHYAAQASSGVYFVDPETKQDICKAEISSTNFSNLGDEFEVELSLNDYRKLKSILNGRKSYRVMVQFDLKHSYFETLHRAVTSIPISAIYKIMLEQSSDELERIKTISHECPHERLSVDETDQLHALRAIMQQPSHKPIVISGPFGSGKTRVIARAVYETVNETLKSKNRARILVCAHHFKTLDTYFTDYFTEAFRNNRSVKVIKIGRQPTEFRSMSLNILTLTAFDFIQEVKHGDYDKYQCVIVVATYMSSITINECLNERVSRQFTHVFLDEAAQPREPEAIAALCATNSSTKVVVAGDSKQVRSVFFA